MKAYTVQFTLPVDNPVNNVTVRRGRKVWKFEVPINHPNAHNFGFQDLIQAVERRELFTLSTDLNNKIVLDSERQKYSLEPKHD